MRDGPDTSVLAGGFRFSPQVSAWKGTDLLAERVPIVGGKLTVSGDQEVPERLTFTVPEWAPEQRGGASRSWVPEGTDDPLGQYGQFVQADLLVQSSVTGEEWTVRLGRFPIQDWSHDDLARQVQVECVGVLQRPLDARFRVPESPWSGGTFASEFRRLMVPGVPVEIDGALVDRAIPTSFQWSEDRLAALYEIVDAWPARMRVDENGTVRLRPPLSSVPDPVLTLTDGQRGTVIGSPRSAGRDGIYNVVVARSSATDDPAKAPLQAVRQVTAGPLVPEVYGEVVRFWSSPLATTIPQLEASADTMLANSIRPAISQRALIVPDPRIELDDAIELVRGLRAEGSPMTSSSGFGTAPFGTSPFGTGSSAPSVSLEDATITRGWVVGYELPLTVDDGPMAVTVGVA